ncbi:hypothetical protein AA0111_g6398 [Alternaria arborescens]|uniref:hypothetical protein n=1 Tax=Alternaria arborescens TaxID=156630 RepID=UPI0010754548|nr:hypothetical protein AA0111_g6398 [Alternaria arborescens]RYO29262.1 hypothetical protein AA0111_g6398 [Alternaria arborescens]
MAPGCPVSSPDSAEPKPPVNPIISFTSSHLQPPPTHLRIPPPPRSRTSAAPESSPAPTPALFECALSSRAPIFLPRSTRAEDAKRFITSPTLTTPARPPAPAYELSTPSPPPKTLSMSDHSAKRQRLDSIGRFSPASPPFDVAAKASGQPTKTPIHPRTPTSPPYSSMNSQSHGGFAPTNSTASSDRSPQSSLPMSHSLSQSATSASNQHPFPTPASTAGFMSSANIDSDGDATMEESLDDDTTRLADHRLSNHNRQGESPYTEDGRLRAAQGISGSQLFKLNNDKLETARPHPSENFITLYRLTPLASSVARNDPVTGEKINKLRKSYEGQIKKMQIAGKPKATKMDGVFRNLLLMPEEIWQSQHVQNREPEKKALTPDGTALSSDFSRLLDDAFAGTAPGTLPSAEAAKYKAYLGTDDTAKPKPQDIPPQRATSFTSSAPTPTSHMNRGAVRPERSSSKRGYTDAAFQGYGEGFGDEYADSTGGEDTPGGNMANKRRKLQFERTSHSVEVGGARR